MSLLVESSHIRIYSETVHRSTGVGFKLYTKGIQFYIPLCSFSASLCLVSLLPTYLDQAPVIDIVYLCVCVYFIYIPRIHRLPYLDHHMST